MGHIQVYTHVQFLKHFHRNALNYDQIITGFFNFNLKIRTLVTSICLRSTVRLDTHKYGLSVFLVDLL